MRQTTYSRVAFPELKETCFIRIQRRSSFSTLAWAISSTMTGDGSPRPKRTLRQRKDGVGLPTFVLPVTTTIRVNLLRGCARPERPHSELPSGSHEGYRPLAEGRWCHPRARRPKPRGQDLLSAEPRTPRTGGKSSEILPGRGPEIANSRPLRVCAE
jgi:hypothetical protein